MDTDQPQPKPLTSADLDALRAFLSPPANLRDWLDHRDAYPGPYRVPAEQAALMEQFARLRRVVLDMRRLAPWLTPRGVTL